MIHPANDKIIALSVTAGGTLKQGSVLKFAAMPDGSGRLQAFASTSSSDQPVANFGIYLAYFIPSDSQVTDFKGLPESTDFTSNSDTGIGGGTLAIASGTECVALGGSKVALVRLDKNSLSTGGTTPFTGTLPAPATVLKYDGTSGLLDPTGSVSVNAGLVVQNDIATIVVLLG